MSRRDPLAIFDGFTVSTLGVNSGSAPIALPRSQLAWATNATVRSNFVKPRPGLIQRPLRFPAITGVPSATLQAAFENGIFEGAIVFERQGKLVSMQGGHLFRIDPTFWDVTDITTVASVGPAPNYVPVYDANPPNRYRAWFAEAEDWIIAQDGISIPWIYDGASTIRSDTIGLGGKPQVPIGKAMVYSQGRLIVSYASGRQFVIGDIVGGDSGTPGYDFRDSVLYFTENDVINGGGAFSTPLNAGFLSAFRPVAQVDTSTGQGPTQVFTTGGIFSLNTPVDRTQWANVTFPIGTVSNINNGSLSDRATINVNGDIWFRALDGIRSFIVARRDFATWVNAPLSYEETRALATDDRNLLTYASAAAFDNRLLMTVRPYRNQGHGICHQGLAILDFNPVTSINAHNPNPVWEGTWSGLQILQVVSGTISGIERCFIFALSTDNKIQLWEVTRDAKSDDADGTTIPTQWTWETGSFSFTADASGSIPLPGRELISLDGGRLYVTDIQGDVIFDIFYRTDQDPCWRTWHSWSVCATQQLCGDGSCITPGNYRAQYRKPFNLPRPAPSCDPAVNKTANVGREFQVRCVITGHCEIRMLELVAHVAQEDVTKLCAPDEACASVSCCPVSDYRWQIA